MHAVHLVLAYFVAILTLCITHLRLHPKLLSTSIYSVAWFDDDVATNKRSSAPQLPPLDTTAPTRLSVLIRRHSTASLSRDVENQSQRSGNLNLDKPLPVPSPTLSQRAWWGRVGAGRPGKDHPFRFRRAKPHEFRWWVKEEHDEQEAGEDKSNGDPPEYPGSRPQSTGESRFLPYPSTSLNEDEPIPVDNRSKWLRAGEVFGA